MGVGGGDGGGGGVGAGRCTPLFLAAREGREETIRVLMGGDVHVQDTKGSTPLHWAERHGRVDLVRWGMGEQETKGYIYSVLGGPGHCARVLHVGA